MEEWQRQFVRSLFPYSGSRLNIEKAFLVKHPHIPRLLYKYREFKDSHIDALRRGVLYLSSPARFNDPFDTTVYFDPSRFLIENLPVSDFIEKVRSIESDPDSASRQPFQTIKNPIRMDEWLRQATTTILKDEAADLRASLTRFMQDWNERQYREMRDRFRAWLRSGYSVLSLSADPTSILMWSHYAKSHEGFCIEYSFGNLPSADLRRRMCFPVLYREKRTDATRYMINSNMAEYNNLFGQYFCILKNSQWRYEKEWRIVHAIGPDHANREIEMPIPSTIIVGIRARSEHVELMREFCRTTGIELKRAEPSDSAPQVLIKKNG